MSVRKRTWRTAAGEEKSRWICDYFDNTGVRRQRQFVLKKDATDWLMMVRGEVKAGTHTPSSVSKTVAQAADAWVANSEADKLELSTVKQRKVHLKVHIKPFLGDVKLSALKARDVTDFDEALRDAGRSIAMRRKVLTSLKAVLKYAQSKGEVAQNVAAGYKVKSNNRNDAGPLREGFDFPTKGELRTLIDKAPARWRALIITAIFTGMRISELRGLRWQDIDLAKAVAHVRQRADNFGQLGMPKSKAGGRDIPLAPLAVNALRQWRSDCPVGPLDLVFPDENGGLESYFTIRSSGWIPLQLEAGICTEAGESEIFLPCAPACGRQFVHCAFELDSEAAAVRDGTRFNRNDLRSLRPPIRRSRRRS